MFKFLCLSALTLLCCVAHAHEPELRFFSLSSHMVPTQMAQQVLTEASKRAHIKLTFIELPNNRWHELAENHQLDGMDYRNTNDPRGDLVRINIPVSQNIVVVYSNKPLRTITSYADLRGYKIGHYHGSSLYDMRLKGMQVETAPTVESLFLKQEAGRTDLVLESSYALCFLKKLNIHDITIRSAPLETLTGYPWISQRYPDIKLRLEHELKKMLDDGSIQRIQQKVLREFHQQCD